MPTPSIQQAAQPRTRPPYSLRNVGIALSLANLLHVRHWSWFLNENNGYFRSSPPHWSMAATTVVGVLVTCVAFLLAKWIAQASLPSRLAREISTLGFLAIGLLALNAVRHQVHALSFERLAQAVGWPPLLLASLGAVVLGAATIRWRIRVVQPLAKVMVWSLPFVAVTFGQGLWAIARRQGIDQRFPDQLPAPRLARVPPAPRVVLLIFDGLDQTKALETPVAGLAMPEFERLRGEAIECTQAYPPSFSTAMSLPSLLLGRGIADVDFAGPKDLWLRLEGRQGTTSWSQEENLFTRARRQGVNVGVVGWYHPYCRQFGSEVASCQAHAYMPDPEYSLAANVRRHMACLVETFPGAIRYRVTARLGLIEPTPGEQRLWHAAQCHAIEAEARRAATDQTLGLVFIHYPVPHFPYIYDRRLRQYATNGKSSYDDNLALADEVLGRLRSAMEGNGMWESSTVVVTADHWNRDQNIPYARVRFPRIGYPAHRVPLLVKVAGQSTRVVFDHIIRTYSIHDLVLSTLRGELGTSQELVAWLEGRTRDSARGDTPALRRP